LVSGGKGHTRWRERGRESPNSDEGTYTVVLYIFVLCVYISHIQILNICKEFKFRKK
jgi:hypothetical protein